MSAQKMKRFVVAAVSSAFSLILVVGSTATFDRPAGAQDFNSGDPNQNQAFINFEAATSLYEQLKKGDCAKCHDGAPDDASKGRFSLKSFNDFQTSVALRHSDTRAALEKSAGGDAKRFKKLLAQPIARGLKKPLFTAANANLKEEFQCRDKKGKHERELSKGEKDTLEMWRGRGLLLQPEAVPAAVALVNPPKAK